MTFAELTKRIKLSPSRKTEYFLKYRSLIDKEKLFIEEMVRIAYNLGKQDEKLNFDSERSEDSQSENILTGLNSSQAKSDLTGLKSKGRKTK